MPLTRTRDPRDPADHEKRAPETAPAPRLPAGLAGMTPERMLALQRAGAGNHALSRVLARAEGDDEVVEDEAEQAVDGHGNQLLLTDRPWSEMFPPPLPLAQPAFDFELPIIIPRASIPPQWLWLFTHDAPPPEPGPSAPLMIEYKPLVPEEPEQVVEAPVTQTEPEQGKKKRKPRKKKKAQQAVAEQAPTTAKTTAPAAKQPEAPAKGALPIDDLMSWFDKPEPGTKSKKKKGQGQTAPPQKKKSEAQKKHEKEQAALKKQKAEAAEIQEKRAAEQEAAAKLEETKLRSALLAKLGAQKTLLTQARDGLLDDEDHADIYDEADAGITELDVYIKGPGKLANSTTLSAKSDTIAALISKVKHFKPALTPEELVIQRRQRVFNEAVVNVPLCFAQNAWEGAFGPQTAFQLDKHDSILVDMILAHFDQDVHEIPGHAGKQYPTKTATSAVYYYVTSTSHTPYIAFDITAHVWDHGVKGQTVHVLHIPQKS